MVVSSNRYKTTLLILYYTRILERGATGALNNEDSRENTVYKVKTQLYFVKLNICVGTKADA